MSAPSSAGCRSCGRIPADMHLNSEGPFCDRCLDDRIAAHAGFPHLPDAPPSVEILDADGNPHTMVYRLSRGPGGISARLVEQNPPPYGGYEFEEFGDHDADPTKLLDLVTVHADTEMARRYLTRSDTGEWQITHAKAASPARSWGASSKSSRSDRSRWSSTVTPSPGRTGPSSLIV